MTDLPADADLPLDHPSFIGGPVLVDYETGDVYGLTAEEPTAEDIAYLTGEPTPPPVAEVD